MIQRGLGKAQTGELEYLLYAPDDRAGALGFDDLAASSGGDVTDSGYCQEVIWFALTVLGSQSPR